MTNKQIKTCIFIAVAFFIFGASIAYAGFGISPPNVLNKNLLPGSSDEQIIYIVRSDPKEALTATIKINAGEATSWITIENGNTFEVPKGIQQFPMKVLVKVPTDAKLGDYKGTIELLTSSVNASKQSAPVKVNMGAEIGIDLSVTNNQLVDYNIQGMGIKDAGKGLPIYLAIKVQNRGNSPAGPTKASIVFYDIYHNQKLWEGQRDIAKKADSFSTSDIVVELPNVLDLGQYWADVELFDGDKSINKNKIVFTVVEASKVAKGGKWAFKITSENFLMILNIGGLLLFVVFIAWLAVKFLGKRKKIKQIQTPQNQNPQNPFDANNKI